MVMSRVVPTVKMSLEASRRRIFLIRLNIGSSHKCVHDNCHLNNCAESPVLKMPKVPKMPKIVERAFSTIDLVSNRQ